VTSLRISFVLSIVLFAFLFSGLVVGLNQDQATARVLFSSETLPAGQKVTGAIFFSSTSPDSVAVTAVSIHFDWMPSGQVVGYQLTTPVTIESGSNHLFDPMQLQIPIAIDSGSHTYFIGIDGTENGTPFSWDSPTASVVVTGGTGSVSTGPSSTNSGGEQPEGQPNLLLYGAIAAVVVVVVLLVVVFVMRKKRTGSKSAVNQEADSQSKPLTPDKKPNPEQDFNI
jgi:hypothetical protein